jgi:FAD/FMN-containing dehydrogenase
MINRISINKTGNTVKIGAGARLGEIYSVLSEQGYGFPGGTCPSVGISGLVLSGGIGLSMRLFGLSLIIFWN